MQNIQKNTPLANNHISVDCVVIGFDGEQLKVLLVKRAGEDNGEVYHDMKLPGSLIYMDEDLDEAAQRVLYELTGLKNVNLMQFKAFGSKNRTSNPKDVRWLERAMQSRVERIVTIAYLSMVKIDRTLDKNLDEHQADIKTISALGGYAASVITAVTVQNTLGVHAVQSVLPEIVRGQIEAVMDDLQPVAIKIGMVSDIQIVRTIVDCLRKYIPEYIVYDPVMVSTSGRKLMSDETIEEIKRELLPLVTLITPNLDEASVLTDKSIHNIHEMQEAAKRLVDEYQTSVLIKGGHLEGDRMCDLLHTSESIFHIYEEKKIESNNLHGTGCTLSSAIATNLAKGYPLRESIQHAKSYITQAIIAGKDLHIGHGNGPLWHFPDSVAQICTFCAVVS